jgi:nucleoside-diphosphate-sugar epimerase
MKEKTSETKNMKIVVLGGTSLIGNKVVNLLRARGHEVVAAPPSLGMNRSHSGGSVFRWIVGSGRICG